MTLTLLKIAVLAILNLGFFSLIMWLELKETKRVIRLYTKDDSK